MALTIARAIENQVYVLACNRVGQDSNMIDYCGDSAIIGFSGYIGCSNFNEEAILIETLDIQLQQEYRAKFSFLESQDISTLDM